MSAIQKHFHYIHDLSIKLHFFCIFRKVRKIFVVINGIGVDCFIENFVIQFRAILETIAKRSFSVVHRQRNTIKIISYLTKIKYIFLNKVSLQ